MFEGDFAKKNPLMFVGHRGTISSIQELKCEVIDKEAVAKEPYVPGSSILTRQPTQASSIFRNHLHKRCCVIAYLYSNTIMNLNQAEHQLS
jgi:hypothetical protein